MGPLFFCFTADNAEEFFNRCLDKEAVTEQERLDVIKQMADEGKLLLAGELESKAGKALCDFFEHTNRQGIVMLKQKDNEDA